MGIVLIWKWVCDNCHFTR